MPNDDYDNGFALLFHNQIQPVKVHPSQPCFISPDLVETSLLATLYRVLQLDSDHLLS